MSILEEIQKTVCYYAQKITGCESKALSKAILMVKDLNRFGLNVFSPAIHSIPQFFIGIRKDWVLEDLFFLEKWLPHVTMIFDASCFNDVIQKKMKEVPIFVPDFKLKGTWDSNGAYEEYRWAKQHHVRCILADPLLTRNELWEML